MKVVQIDHPDDTGYGLRNESVKIGLRGIEWWWSFTHMALPFSYGFGRWYGPHGYENGSWCGWNLYLGFLCFGCSIEWVSTWVPKDPSDPTPRLRDPKKGPKRRRMVEKVEQGNVDSL